MPHPIAFAVLGGLVSSALFLSLVTGFTGMVLLAYFVQLPLLLVGLTVGLTGSLIAVVSGVLASSLVAGLMATFVYTVVQALPALLVVRQALLSRDDNGQVEWYPPGLLLAQLTAVAAAAIVILFVSLLSEPGGLKGAVESLVAHALVEIGGLAPDAEPPAGFGRFMFLFPGLMGASWLIMVVVNAAAAQAVAVRMGRNRRPSPDFGRLELPWWLWPAIATAAFLSLLGEDGFGFLGRSLLIVLIVPYTFLGLAVLHVLVRRWSYPGLALTVIYGCIVVLGWPLLLVLLLGFIEDWARLRQRLA